MDKKECVECGDYTECHIIHPDFPEDYLCDDCAVQVYEQYADDAQQLLDDVKNEVSSRQERWMMIKRYSQSKYWRMNEFSDGKYVTYEDHKAEIDALKQYAWADKTEIAELVDMLEDVLEGQEHDYSKSYLRLEIKALIAKHKGE